MHQREYELHERQREVRGDSRRVVVLFSKDRRQRRVPSPHDDKDEFDDIRCALKVDVDLSRHNQIQRGDFLSVCVIEREKNAEKKKRERERERERPKP